MTINKSVTRKDVAIKAGVSVSAVSRAINNSGYVKKEKKKRIIQIANEMGYIPNPVAMALQQKKTYQLLFFCNDLTGSYFNQMYHGMAREAKKRGYHVLASLNITDFGLVKKTLVDGILFQSESVAQDYAETIGRNYHVPTVAASFQPACVYAKPMPSVIIDNNKIINAMIDYLIEKGHRKIGMALPFNNGYARDRFKYWRQRMMVEIGEECLDYVLDVNDECRHPKERLHSDLQDFYSESDGFIYYDLVNTGRNAARMYAKLKNKFTAIICFDDDMAIGMIEELIKLGIRIPEDLSVMGIDGIYTRNHHEPKLTTMGIFPDRQGAKCAEILINMIEGKKYKYINYSPYGILEGETVKTIN